MLRGLAPLLATLLAGLAGCGGGDDGSATPTSTAPARVQPPPLALKPPRKGELVFTGATSSTTFSGVKLAGTYVVRFEQRAPKDPRMDFSGKTPFSARLRPASSTGSGIELFRAASAKGQRMLTAKRGTYALVVTSGDFPFAVRFTPRR